jgi:hypothetical protein
MVGVPSLCLFLKIGVLLAAIAVQTGGENFKKDERIFTNGWAIQVNGGSDEAKRIATAHGFEKIEAVSTHNTFEKLFPVAFSLWLGF